MLPPRTTYLSTDAPAVPRDAAALAAENQELRARLEEAEEALRAIREGEVDAVIVSGSKGDRVFSLTETENLHRLMVETMNEAGLATSADGLLLYVNTRAAALLERSRSELLGRPIADLVVDADVPRLQQLLDASRAGTADNRVLFRTARGAEVPMHLWASRLPRSGEAMICLVGTDLTRLEADQAILKQLREHEQALKDSRAEALELLAQALVAREQTAELAQELRESDRRKDAFLATLAHELRNPLAPICHALEILRLRDRDAHPTAHAETCAMMARHLDHLVHLVDDLMDVSRITHGKIELLKQRLQLSSVIASAVETVQPLLAQSGQRLHIELPPEPIWLEGDPTRLTQIFGNLLNNAIKYTAAGEHIGIRAWVQTPGEVEVAVEDSGIGIPAEILPQVFDMFSQAPSSRPQTQGGLGIGLTLVRKFVELHGGQVAAFSAGRAQGSRIQVRLPLAASPLHGPSRSAGDVPAVGTLAGRRILVVDDNQDAATSLAQALRLKGAEVGVAFAGDAALDRLAEADAEVVILDIDMPAPDGYEVARRIRANPAWDGIQLIAMTGLGTADVHQDSLAAGFDRHLVKPVSFEVLDALLAGTPAQRPRSGRAMPAAAVSPADLSGAAARQTGAGAELQAGTQVAEHIDARITSILHDLMQPLSSVRCFAMVAQTLAAQLHPQDDSRQPSQDGPQSQPLHVALAGIDAQIQRASELLEHLREALKPAHRGSSDQDE